jgi:hypothetical protein
MRGEAAMKKPTTAKKTAGKKKKKATTVGAATRGCCTLTGSGPAEQYEGITKEECRQLAIQRGKNHHWWAGKCAAPN